MSRGQFFAVKKRAVFRRIIVRIVKLDGTNALNVISMYYGYQDLQQGVFRINAR